MTLGMNDLSRVWDDLRRKEDELKWGGGFPGTGPQFDSMGRLLGSSSYRGLGWVGEQLGRVDRVRQALRNSGPLAQQLVSQTFAGIDMLTVGSILVAACMDFALYYFGSIAGGGLIGGVSGAFLGGVGAIPGAATGMAAGAYVGGWVLAIVGLKSLVEGLAHSIPEALGFYARGFNEAWGPTRQDVRYGLHPNPTGNVALAAFDLANGHVILVAAILTALLAYLARGKGDRTALLNEVSNSRRLGPKVATWLEQNEEKLRRHPALQSRARKNGGAGESPPPPSGPHKPQGREMPLGMPPAKVPCFTTKGLPQGQIPEFDRQLAGQEAGINNLTVAEYLAARDAFDTKLSARDPNIARNARANYFAQLTKDFLEQYREQGMSRSEAKAKAAEKAIDSMKSIAALHNPDMVAGGKDVISDFGNGNINKRIGAQWRKKGRLVDIDDAANLIPESIRSRVKMNVKLKRC